MFSFISAFCRVRNHALHQERLSSPRFSLIYFGSYDRHVYVAVGVWCFAVITTGCQRLGLSRRHFCLLHCSPSCFRLAVGLLMFFDSLWFLIVVGLTYFYPRSSWSLRLQLQYHFYPLYHFYISSVAYWTLHQRRRLLQIVNLVYLPFVSCRCLFNQQLWVVVEALPQLLLNRHF